MKVQPLINGWNGYDHYTVRLALLLVPILLTGVRIHRHKGRHCLFHKSQLDSQTFGMQGSMGLWTRYHSKCLVIVALKLKELKVSQLSI